MEVKDAKNQSAKAPCGAYRSAMKTAHIKEQDLKQFFIRKRSVDGRKKPELYYVYTVDLIVANEEHVKKISKGKLQTVQEKNYHIPEHGAKKLLKRTVWRGRCRHFFRREIKYSCQR